MKYLQWMPAKLKKKNCLVCGQITQVEINKPLIIHGWFGNAWGDNFYMGTQNGSKLEILPEKILIHTLELKLWPFKVFPYIYIGSYAFAMFSAHALCEGRGYARI